MGVKKVAVSHNKKGKTPQKDEAATGCKQEAVFLFLVCPLPQVKEDIDGSRF
jgi:hypothetical protein